MVFVEPIVIVNRGTAVSSNRWYLFRRGKHMFCHVTEHKLLKKSHTGLYLTRINVQLYYKTSSVMTVILRGISGRDYRLSTLYH
jgi:hypothetical protein